MTQDARDRQAAGASRNANRHSWNRKRGGKPTRGTERITDSGLTGPELVDHQRQLRAEMNERRRAAGQAPV